MNKLTGVICDIEAIQSVAIINVSIDEFIFSASILGSEQELKLWTIGQNVAMAFSETEVAIGKAVSGQLSIRNRFPGTVIEIEKKEILTKIIFKMNEYEISSVITTRSANQLDLKIGDWIEGFIKSNEISLIAII